MWRDLARVGEATLALLVAGALVRFVGYRRWRGLTARSSGGSEPARAARVRVAIGRAERRSLGRPLRCLSRAMAVHWMLTRRGIASAVTIGAIDRAGGLDFHAWVESEGVTIIGASSRRFAPVLIPGRR